MDKFRRGFLYIYVHQDCTLVIDVNTRIQYLAGNFTYQKSSDSTLPITASGMSMLYEKNGKPSTISEEELEYLLSKAWKIQSDRAIRSLSKSYPVTYHTIEI
ncbi:MAG: hypothetical protein IKY26_10460 [Erysipelotrichaceae bacterium]|nr:hypothetical protein [Erysipelotrichaceae bacterium]